MKECGWVLIVIAFMGAFTTFGIYRLPLGTMEGLAAILMIAAAAVCAVILLTGAAVSDAVTSAIPREIVEDTEEQETPEP